MRGRALVAWNLRQIRVNGGLSQKKLAFDAGIDRSYVGGFEREEENPTVDLLDPWRKRYRAAPEERPRRSRCAADVDRPSDCYPDDRWWERSAAGSFDAPVRGLIKRGIINVRAKVRCKPGS
jgi:transcriptional regulator with XRE-family HTH domain